MKGKEKILVLALVLAIGIFAFGGFSAAANNIYEKNYTINPLDVGQSGVNFVVRELKYEPYPAQAGEWFDFYVKVQNIGQDNAPNVEFKLLPESPFASDDNLTRDYGILYGTSDAYKVDKTYAASEVVLKYKVRVADDASEGTSNLKLEIIPNKDVSQSRTYELPIIIKQKNSVVPTTSSYVDNTQKWIYALIGFLTGFFLIIIISLFIRKRKSGRK